MEIISMVVLGGVVVALAAMNRYNISEASKLEARCGLKDIEIAILDEHVKVLSDINRIRSENEKI